MTDRERMSLVSQQKAVVSEVLNDLESTLLDTIDAIDSVINAGYPLLMKETIDDLKRISRAMSKRLTR